MNGRDKIAAALLVTTAVVSTFAIASTTRFTAVLSCGLAVLCALPYIGARRRFTRIPRLVWLLAAIAIATAIQLLPMPSALLGLLSPAKLELVTSNAAALGQAPPSLSPISIDPPATLLELAKLCGYFVFAVTALLLIRSQRGRLVLTIAVGGLGMAVAVTALGHHAVSAGSLFGMYEPQHMRPPPYISPILGPNQLATFMALTAPVCIGLAAHHTSRWRALWVGGALACIAVGVLVAARAGGASMIIGCAAAVYLITRRRRRERRGHRSSSQRWPLLVVAACAVVLIATFTGSDFADELLSTDTAELSGQRGKIAAWKSGLSMVSEYAPMGSGRGAFEAGFTAVHDSGDAVHSHIENEYLQLLIDHGVPIGLGLLLLLCAAALPVARAKDSTLYRAGALGGLIGIALASFFDFALAFPGIAIPTLALVCSATPTSFSDKTKRPTSRQRGLRIAAVALALSVVAIAASPLGQQAREETARAAAAPNDLTVESAVAIFERHPSDYVAAALVANSLFRQRDPRSIRVVNRALTIHPTHVGTHLLSARILRTSQNPNQALDAFRRAVRYSRVPLPILRELSRAFPDVATAAKGLPTEVKYLAALVRDLRKLGNTKLAVAYLSRVHAERPGHPHVAEWLAAAALADGDDALVDRIGAPAFEEGATAELAVILGSARIRSGDLAGAAAVAERGLGETSPSVGHRWRLLRVLVAAYRRQNKPDDARSALLRADGWPEESGQERAWMFTQLAEIEEQLGNRNQAERYRERAAAP